MNCKLSATALAVFALYLARAAPAQKAYISYETLEAWRSLVLAAEAREKVAQGQTDTDAPEV